MWRRPTGMFHVKHRAEHVLRPAICSDRHRVRSPTQKPALVRSYWSATLPKASNSRADSAGSTSKTIAWRGLLLHFSGIDPHHARPTGHRPQLWVTASLEAPRGRRTSIQISVQDVDRFRTALEVVAYEIFMAPGTTRDRDRCETVPRRRSRRLPPPRPVTHRTPVGSVQRTTRHFSWGRPRR